MGSDDKTAEALRNIDNSLKTIADVLRAIAKSLAVLAAKPPAR